MNILELIAALLGLANVALVVRRSLWNYAFGLAMVLLYAVVFFDARLYSDALLQGFFFVVQLYGWWNWARAQTEQGKVVVLALPQSERRRWALGCVLVAGVWGYGMDRFTDAAFPWIDAAIAVVSVAAQILQSRRVLESWWLWIAVDLGSVALYAAKGVWPTTALYAVFLVMAIWGLIDWRAAERRRG